MNRESPNLPRGIRNNNPGNILVNPGFAWRGQTGVDSDGYLLFSAPVYGLRAICILWVNYREYHGCVTIRDYISRWAPPVSNNTEAYIRFVCSCLGIGPNEAVDIHACSKSILEAIVTFENGEQPYSDRLLYHAIRLSHIR